MADPRSHVSPGQPLSLAAAQVNWINQQMRGAEGNSGPSFDAYHFASNIVLVKNTVSDCKQCGVLAVSGVQVDPSGGDLEGNDDAAARARAFARKPVLTGIVPVAGVHTLKFVVTLEPIKSGKIGRAAIGGCFACRVRIDDESHQFAQIIDGNIEQLRSASCGVLQLLWKEPGTGDNKWAVGVM